MSFNESVRSPSGSGAESNVSSCVTVTCDFKVSISCKKEVDNFSLTVHDAYPT